MRQLRAIARREIGAFFHSAMAPAVLTGFLVAVGLFFTLLACRLQRPVADGHAEPAGSGNYLNLAEGLFRPLVAIMTFFLLLLMPAVTMRLFAPEYRSGRCDLIASWPVPDTSGCWASGSAPWRWRRC